MYIDTSNESREKSILQSGIWQWKEPPRKKAESGKRSFLLIRGLFLTTCSAVIINIP